MSKLRDFFRRLRSMSPDEIEETGRRGAANVDAMAVQSSPRAEAQGEYNTGIPPNYIDDYDEGRPKH
jgi:hypothetical protein